MVLRQPVVEEPLPRAAHWLRRAIRGSTEAARRAGIQCYFDAASRGIPDARAAAAANLNFRALNLNISPGDAFDAAARLARDKDPVVQAAAASSLVLFDESQPGARRRRSALL